jgi:hypothetical protein
MMAKKDKHANCCFDACSPREEQKRDFELARSALLRVEEYVIFRCAYTVVGARVGA